MRVVRIEDGAGGLAPDGRLELSRSAPVEDVDAEAQPACLLGLAPGAGERVCLLVHAQRATTLEPGIQPALGKLGVNREARERELADDGRGCPRPLWCRRLDEAGDPRKDRRPRPKVERAVLLPHPAQAVAERRRVCQRRRVARADQACVSGRAAPSEVAAALEERDAGATLNELERAARPDRAAADDDDVRSAGRHADTLVCGQVPRSRVISSLAFG